MVINKDNINQFIIGTIMDCSEKNITSIEYIPDNITHLYCDNNQLTSYPKHEQDKQWWLNHNKQINRSIVLKKLLNGN